MTHSAEWNAAISAGVRLARQRMRAEGRQFAPTPTAPCQHCGRAVSVNNLARHERNCMLDLPRFVAEYADRLTLDRQTGCVSLAPAPGRPKLGDDRSASRAVLEMFIGRPLGDEYALHSCDNKRCVNWWHLRPGTHEENMKDMVDRKTYNVGPANHARWHVNRGLRKEGCKYCG